MNPRISDDSRSPVVLELTFCNVRNLSRISSVVKITVPTYALQPYTVIDYGSIGYDIHQGIPILAEVIAAVNTGILWWISHHILYSVVDNYFIT